MVHQRFLSIDAPFVMMLFLNPSVVHQRFLSIEAPLGMGVISFFSDRDMDVPLEGPTDDPSQG